VWADILQTKVKHKKLRFKQYRTWTRGAVRLGRNLAFILVFTTLLAGCSREPEVQRIRNQVEIVLKDDPFVDVTLRPTPTTLAEAIENREFISVAAWNLKIFGKSKAEDQELMSYYADKIDDYDIVFIQEIRDASGDAFRQLCAALPQHSCRASSRAGRSSSKEQYGLIFKDMELLEFQDWNEGLPAGFEDVFERPPLTVKFRKDDFDFYATVIHTKPTDADAEITALERLVGNISDDSIVLGDLNADCSYYQRDDFSGWLWAVGDGEDTTVGRTDCAYDRILINSEAHNNYMGYGIMDDVQPDQSDHYLIWAHFNTNVA